MDNTRTSREIRKKLDNDENKIIKKKIIGLSIIQSDGSAVYVIPTLEQLKNLFEDERWKSSHRKFEGYWG